ncbi:MAG: retroviral-like aspartic protease family protein [Actinomycetota bacterium]
MGLTHVEVTVTSASKKNGAYTAEFLVDSGATDSIIASDELQRFGIEPETAGLYELADGSRREFQIGGARLEFMGAIRFATVVFGAPGAEPVLGVTALESAGFMLDPTTQTLKKLPAIPLK